MKPVLFLNILFLLLQLKAGAQQLTGVWSGKISRQAANYRAVESIEIQIYQNGNVIWGNSFSFKDTSRFVLYKIEGKRNKKQKIIAIKEFGQAYYRLPENFFPCEKFFELQYFKVGKTQYLSGKWSGKGLDTSCFPGEELLVVLQKIKKPEYPLESFVQQKMLKHLIKRNYKADTIALLPSEDAVVVTQLNKDSLPLDRKIDIQEIVRLSDTIVKCTLYDNAIVDDDTVSVFVNKIPVLIKQRISAKPLSFNIKLNEPGKPVEIIMQAENLGSIPPNTAVMIIETANKRYEVRLSAGFEKHAAIIITYDTD
jgi:hypothetical protein